MRLLFVHQNFPGQYRHLAAYYAGAGHEVVALGDKENLRYQPRLPGVRLFAEGGNSGSKPMSAPRAR